MKVSTRGEYGVRAMVALAKHSGDQPVSIGVISRESSVPYAYLEQLIVPLRRAGLVASKRGAHGGYVLSRPATDIKVGEVYRAMEGPVAPMECVSENEADQTCPLIPGCQTRPVWVKVRGSIVDTIDSITLADLLGMPTAAQAAQSTLAESASHWTAPRKHHPGIIVSTIYLDHAATTPLDPVVLQAMHPFLTEEFGNPSSIYGLGQAAKAAIQQARQTVSRITGFDPAEVVFTSGSTESIRMALTGVAWAARKRGITPPHIVSTAIEHSAVIDTLRWLDSIGFAHTLVGADMAGLIDLAAIEAALTGETVLVSVMAANNEVGSVQPTRTIGDLVRSRGIPFHVDATQAAGTLPIDSGALGADLVSISAHKFCGPKGVGVLAARRSVALDWVSTGGGQEGGKRGGTENVAGIVGLGVALERADANRDAYAAHCAGMRDLLWNQLQEHVPDIVLNGPEPGPDRLPLNLNVRIPGLQGETMLVNLDLLGIAASAGSACTVGRNDPSHVLLAMGQSDEDARSSLRLTVGRSTSQSDIEEAAQAIAEVATRVRSMSRPATA